MNSVIKYPLVVDNIMTLPDLAKWHGKITDMLRENLSADIRANVRANVKSEDGVELKRTEDSAGIIRYFANGGYHRLDGPALIWPDRAEQWYKHGKLHRDDGPAALWPERGIEVWYKDGKKYQPSAHEIMAWKMKKKES